MSRITVFVFTLALLASSCGGSDSTPVVAAPEEPSASTPDDDGSAAANELLDFTAPTIDGGQLRGSELAGRDVIMWFWAPW